MRVSFWLRVPLAGLGLGITTAIHIGLGGFLGIYFVGYFVLSLFFRSRENRWWYNLVPFAVLTGIALMGTGTFAVICAVLPMIEHTTQTCATVETTTVLWLYLSLLNSMAAMLWFGLSAALWWQNRRH